MGSIEEGRSFSSLGRIHTWLCNTMNTERTPSPFMQIKFPSIKGWEAFMAQNRRLMMATNKFLVTV